MITLNLLPLYSTWHAYGTDGFEQVGFPFVFFERGGITYQNTMHVHWLLADVVIAVATAYYVAHLLRDGSIAAFRRLQTWGFSEGA